MFRNHVSKCKPCQTYGIYLPRPLYHNLLKRDFTIFANFSCERLHPSIVVLTSWLCRSIFSSLPWTDRRKHLLSSECISLCCRYCERQFYVIFVLLIFLNEMTCLSCHCFRSYEHHLVAITYIWPNAARHSQVVLDHSSLAFLVINSSEHRFICVAMHLHASNKLSHSTTPPTVKHDKTPV